ncbi:phage tail protein [Acinetobacter sp. TGL-Y2]|uniref:phage tail-collar fiber domain-containing protein n=1 Tax=Acinetobacter sp. TGL-Y2 TaxID=1407071 RepID=UPI001D0DD197|nr:phage tail protein [Acinetobacter sp. TGL-Y2]
MANTYKGILTNNGKALIANATVSNKINYSHIAVGDGNGSVPTPSETRPTLINEKARIALNVVEINPNNTNQIVCEAIIPTNTGGFYIRELGLYAGNTMIVNASYPPTYKPLADEGGAREIAIKIVINIQNAEVIALYLDDSLIYATREWVNTNYIRRNEIVDNLTRDDSNKPLSAKQGKYLEDNKLNKAINIPVNADLNNYKTQGSFFVDLDVYAATIKNSPTWLSFTLQVDITAGVVQRLTTYNGGGTKQYIRSYYQEWSEWYEIYSKLNPQPTVDAIDDLNSSDAKKPLSANQGKKLNEKKVEVGNSFSDSFAKDVDYYQDHLTEQTFKSFDDFPLGSRILVSKNINLLNAPNIADDFIYIETKTTYKKNAPGRLQMATGYSSGEIAVRSAPTNANYGSWKNIAHTNSNVASATKLQIARNITIAGDANGTTYFDGTSNVSINMVLAMANTSAGTYGANTLQIPVFTVDNKGRITSAGNRMFPSASTTVQGAVQLNNTLTSTSVTEALTAAQGKTLFDSKLSKSTKISSGDLNHYQEPGLYWCDADAEAATILNLPTPFAFSLFVERHAGAKQTFTEYNTNRTFIRRFYNGSWTSWKEIAFSDNQTFTGSNKFNGDVQVAGAIYAQKFRGESDFWFTSNDGGIAKKVLSGGLLASSNYADVSYVPENGIYSKGNILTAGGFFTTRAETTISNSSGRYLFINLQKWGAFDPATGYIPLSVDCGGTGNGQGIAPSASKLQIARNINNVLFDGTGDINITAPMRYLGNANNSTLNSSLEDGFYLVADSNISGFYGYGILEVRKAGATIHQTYYAHNKNVNGSVAVRQSWNGGQNFTEWRSLDPQGSVTLSGQISGSASFDDSGNINISASVVQGLGINQTWRNVTSQRAANTTYTNNRSVPIKVAIYLEAGGNNAYANLSVGGEFLFAFSNTTAWGTSRGGEITVPPYTTYRVDGTFTKWSELT